MSHLIVFEPICFLCWEKISVPSSFFSLNLSRRTKTFTCRGNLVEVFRFKYHCMMLV
jgi:hypothetical protein